MRQSCGIRLAIKKKMYNRRAIDNKRRKKKKEKKINRRKIGKEKSTAGRE